MIVLKNTPINQIFYIMRNAKNGSGCWDLTHSNVEYNSNGTFTIAPPEGYDGLSSVTVKVDVEGACTGIETSESEINSAKEGGEHIIGISSSTAWTATASEDWITVTPNSGEGGVAVITITVSENEGEERTGTVTIVNDNGDVNVIEITQDGIPSYRRKHLTIEAITAGTLNFNQSVRNLSRTIEYSVDNGETWTEITSAFGGAIIANLQAGEKVLLRGDNASYWGDSDLGEPEGWTYLSFIGNDTSCNVSGNIMSLVDSINYATNTTFTKKSVFSYFFRGMPIVDASNLILPATTLTTGCYSSMFYRNSKLVNVPSLPATTLVANCYQGMFQECTSLVSVPIDLLPATTLATTCYGQMFYGDTSLTSSPNLPAETLQFNCYNSMFDGCTSLDYIHSFATNVGVNDTINWLRNVYPTGTFVCPNPSVWTTGASGIPSGWTVETI